MIVALALHGTLDPLDPRSGLTGERLRRQCTSLQLCSRGRVLSIIDGLKQAGHLVMAPASGDGADTSAINRARSTRQGPLGSSEAFRALFTPSGSGWPARRLARGFLIRFF